MGSYENSKCAYFSIMDYHTGTELNLTGAPAISLHTSLSRQKHTSEVLSCEFHPKGQFVISSNHNGDIHVCDTNSDNMMLLKGHSGAVNKVNFSKDGTSIYSCSSDETICIWDVVSGIQTSCLKGHSSEVNSVQEGEIVYPIMVSGSNDGTVGVWDARANVCAMSLDSGAEVNAVCFNENGEYAFSTGVDEEIKVWDLRMSEVVCRLQGHTSTVTGITLSPCGSYVLSNSLDNTLRIWDVRPHAQADRLIGCFPVQQSNASGLLRCAWSPDGRMISAGTSDGVVCVWDPMSGVKLFELPTQKGIINDVTFHPNDFVMLTASSDKSLCLYELSK